MSFFVQPTNATLSTSLLAERIAVLLAGAFVLLSVGQLFGFEKFPSVIMAWRLPGVGEGGAVLLAAIIVILEVSAIPFLLRMRLSALMRKLSMISGWAIGAWWLSVSIWQNVAVAERVSSGLLGAAVYLPVGWWSFAVAVSIVVLIAWINWCFWPVQRRDT